MINNAFKYVKRHILKTLLIFIILVIMMILSITGLSLKKAINKEAKNSYAHIASSFSLEINRQYNQGTARGGGNIKHDVIKKIGESKYIESYIKRINSVADIVDHDLIENEDTLRNPREKFKRALMLTGVNDSSKETKFLSGAFKLVEGRHLNDKDTYKVLMHKDLALKNKLKVGDKIILQSNLWDADNEKGANNKVEAEIVGLFDGHNKGRVTASQELYENNLITDLKTAAEVYGNTLDTAPYQDASFNLKRNYDLDKVMKEISKMDIEWRLYNLIKSSANYPALEKAISSSYAVADQLFVGSIIIAGFIISLLLFLWLNERQKEVAILLSLGFSKVKIFMQFLFELIIIFIPAFLLSIYLSGYTSQKISNYLITSTNKSITESMIKEAGNHSFGGGAEAEGFQKALDKVSVKINKETLVIVFIFMLVVLFISLYLATSKLFKKEVKDLLTDNK